MERVGLYIHTPFCVSKCPYCDSVLNCAEYTWALSSIKGLYQKS